MKFRGPILLVMALLISFPGKAAPFIQTFNPTFGASNDNSYIVITGTGFYPGTLLVKFNNVEAFDYAAISSTEIKARIRAGTPLGPGRIFVSVAGVSTQSGNLFTVIGPGPFVTNFTPVAGPAGTTVTIEGVHFTDNSYSSPVTNVSFNGISGPNLWVSSPNLLTVDAPGGVSTGPLTLRSALGTFITTSNIITTATNFFVPPRITGFSPVTGRTGTNVMLTGSNFLYATAVTFNGVTANFTLPTNNSTLWAVVPPGASTGPILVNTPANNPYTTTSNFVVQPTISGFTPGAGPVGTSVTVTGASFNAGGLTVKFGGVTAQTNNVTFSQFTTIVPVGATNAPITVTTVGGSMTSTQLFYLPASITSFTPTNSGPTVRIDGQNFIGATAVTFTGASPVTPRVTNNTTIGVDLPVGVITGPISVTTPAGTTSSGTKWFYGAPVINSFTPTSGLPGTNVTILGTNFIGVTGVRFGSPTVVIPTFIHNGQITALVPTGALTGPITVMAPGGTNASAGVFTLNTVDLSVNVADAPDPVFVGSNLVYTITIANNSALAAPNLKLTNTLPASVGLKSATTTQGSLATNSNPILGTLGTLGAGGSAIVTLTVVPLMSSTIANSASAGCDYPDSVLANNSSSIATTVWPLPLLSIARLTNEVQVTWPAPLSNFTLQFIPALAGNLYWSNLDTAPVLSGTNNVVVDPSTKPSRFYRLKQ